MTHAPLPEWSNLFKAIWQRSLNHDELSVPWTKEGEVSGWFSRSAWSLVRVALWRQQNFQSKEIIVWVPDFFCNTSLTPLRALNIKLVFYPINHKLEPDYKTCRALAKNNIPDLFLLVHYFGRPTSAAPARDFCMQNNTWLIEDAAHVLRPISGVGKYGDFIMYSPHKLLPVPDGAVLIVRSGGPSKFDAEKLHDFGSGVTWAKEVAENSSMKRVPVCSSLVANTEWLIKRIIQKTGVVVKRDISEFFETGTADSNARAFSNAELSPLAHRLLGTLTESLGNGAHCRQRHQLLWDHLLLDESEWEREILPTTRPEHREWTPYLAAFSAKDENAAAKIFESMSSKGLPVTTWPDLAPEVCENREVHKCAWELRHNCFYLPQHQGLRSKDILAVLGLLRKENFKKIESLELQWNKSTRTEWNSMMQQTGRSNMLQSWAYGNAKAKVEGWIVNRVVVLQNNKPIAFVQILEKRFAFVKLFRINRGPLYTTESNQQLIESVSRLLANSLGDWKKGRFLSFVPELPLTGMILAMMVKLRFFQSTNRGWESSWVDLTYDKVHLREKLNSKWRNMLSYAENKGLRSESFSGSQNYEWLVHRCSQMMKERGETIPTAVYSRLLLEMQFEQPMQIFKAFLGSEPLAGICIVSHGNAATYLLGWNGPKGRNLKANQFLLWNAMMSLKEKGIRWFDLGGIDEDNTPGISDFKLGVNGERFYLVGEGMLF